VPGDRLAQGAGRPEAGTNALDGTGEQVFVVEQLGVAEHRVRIGRQHAGKAGAAR
jgi:hypothetical protein